jgi:hypothetical protein
MINWDGESPLVMRDAIMKNPLALNKFLSEVHEKYLFERLSSAKLTKRIHGLVSTPTHKFDELCVDLKEKEITISCGWKKCIVLNRSDRVNTMLDNGLSKEQVAIIGMRYLAIAEGSQHWGLPQSAFNAMYDGGVRTECFASPNNSRALILNRTAHTDELAQFCSAFPDVDSAAGSIGNFFHKPADEYVGDLAVNPPFIETIMASTDRHISEAMDRSAMAGRRLIAYVFIPAWDNNESVINFTKGQYTVAVRRLNKGQYLVELPDGTTQKAWFATYLVALATVPIEDTNIASTIDEVIRVIQSPR